jgi:hypothetical protein
MKDDGNTQFLEKISTPDEDIAGQIKRIKKDTDKHNIMLVNHSKGVI